MKYILIVVLAILLIFKGCNLVPTLRMSEFIIYSDPSFQHALTFKVYERGAKYFVDFTVFSGIDHKRNLGILAHTVKELDQKTISEIRAAFSKIDFWNYDVGSDVRDGTEIRLRLLSFPFYTMRTCGCGSYSSTGNLEGLNELIEILYRYNNVSQYQVKL